MELKSARKWSGAPSIEGDSTRTSFGAKTARKLETESLGSSASAVVPPAWKNPQTGDWRWSASVTERAPSSVDVSARCHGRESKEGRGGVEE